MPAFDKLKLLIWKNFLLQRRDKWQTIFEILSPVVFVILLIVIRCLVAPIVIPKTTYPSFYPKYFNTTGKNLGNLTSSTKTATLAFSPERPLTRNVKKGVLATIANDNFGFLFSLFYDENSLPQPRGYKNAKKLELALTQPNAMNDILVGIKYDDQMTNATTWPDHIKFALRFPALMRAPSINHPLLSSWRTNMLFPLFPQSGPREPEDKYGGKSPGHWQLLDIMYPATSKSSAKII